MDKKGFVPGFIQASKKVMEENPEYEKKLRETMELLNSGLFDGDLSTKKTRQGVIRTVGDKLKVW